MTNSPTPADRTIEISGHKIAPGKRHRFELDTPNLYTNTPLGIPVEVINGAKPGPVLLICAAIHGDELNGTEIIRRISGTRNIHRVHGTLILVPAVNIYGCINQSRYLPDRRDLNRCFPGSDSGSLASRPENTAQKNAHDTAASAPVVATTSRGSQMPEASCQSALGRGQWPTVGFPADNNAEPAGQSNFRVLNVHDTAEGVAR